VVRSAPDADDIALFAGTGLTAVGRSSRSADRFVNLLPQDVQGIDFGIVWRLRTRRIGTFRVNINAANN
jgi:iron complex outermembrane receptor protein